MRNDIKILVINGPNLNFLGIREPEIYGNKTYEDLVNFVKTAGEEAGAEITCFQSNHEGAIIDRIQEAFFEKYDGIVINPGGYTHTSVAILDAVKAVMIPTVEVHLSDIHSRDEFRNVSYISLAAERTIYGKGFEGYRKAIIYLVEKFS